TRITIVGATFLGLIAVLPSIAQSFTGISTLTVGGTGLLIVVSVVLETAKQLQSQVVAQNYEKFIS
ncbi:MAG TPA: preprotein translocase subunit SecY, partial [Patescibacteria group bacterium]|nr:preprotein translocase subunit SecY [Patescibacteria group bacterium]